MRASRSSEKPAIMAHAAGYTHAAMNDKSLARVVPGGGACAPDRAGRSLLKRWMRSCAACPCGCGSMCQPRRPKPLCAPAPSGPANFWSMATSVSAMTGLPAPPCELAALLAENGVKKGDRVALVMRNLPEWPVGLHGRAAGGRHRRAAQCLVDRYRTCLWHPGLRRAVCICRCRKAGAAERPAALGRTGVCHPRANPPAAVTVLEDVIGAPAHWATCPNARCLMWRCHRKTMPPSFTPPAPPARPRARWAPIAR